MPATLKNALDFLSAEWARKPVGFISYGNTSAGTRSVQMAKQVVTTLHMLPTGATIVLRMADTIEDGQVRADVALVRSAQRLLTELLRVEAALRVARPAEYDLVELLVLQRCCWLYRRRDLADRSTHGCSRSLGPRHREVAAGPCRKPCALRDHHSGFMHRQAQPPQHLPLRTCRLQHHGSTESNRSIGVLLWNEWTGGAGFDFHTGPC